MNMLRYRKKDTRKEGFGGRTVMINKISQGLILNTAKNAIG